MTTEVASAPSHARPARAWQPFRAHRLRKRADQLLRARVPAWGAPKLIPWRAAELTSPHERGLLARSLHSIRRELDAVVLPSASPLARAALRPHAAWLRGLELRLADLDASVSPRGILLLRDLLTDPGGPLYTPERAEQLPGRARAILAALDEPAP